MLCLHCTEILKKAGGYIFATKPLRDKRWHYFSLFRNSKKKTFGFHNKTVLNKRLRTSSAPTLNTCKEINVVFLKETANNVHYSIEPKASNLLIANPTLFFINRTTPLADSVLDWPIPKFNPLQKQQR